MSLQTPNESTRTGRLPLPLILAIVALALVTVFVIIAVFTGNMNTYGGEVVVTVVYFAVFVLTLIGALAIESRARAFPLLLAVLADSLFMAYGVLLTWVNYVDSACAELYNDYCFDAYTYGLSNAWTAFWILIPVWVVFILPVLAAWVGAKLSGESLPLHAIWWVASVLLGVLAVMSWLPLLLERSFGFAVLDLYWRITAAIWIMTIAVIAVYALLYWFYRKQLRAARAQVSAEPGPAVSAGGLTPWPFAEDGLTPLPAGAEGVPRFDVLATFDGRPGPVQPGDPEALAAIERGRVVAEAYRTGARPSAQD